MVEILHSEEDKSVNFILPTKEGKFESRFVQRKDDYFIIYLSSLDGCDRACRMCHLTATGQTSDNIARLNDFIVQAYEAFKHVDTIDVSGAKYMHFNFMARGEPLDNYYITNQSNRLFGQLGEFAYDRGLQARFLISTIMPTMTQTLTQMFGSTHPTPNIYYSLYSMDLDFRKKWLGKAGNPWAALLELSLYRKEYETTSKIHFAFIEGENDREEDMVAIYEALNASGLKDIGINIVRYNPYSEKYGKESSLEVIERNVDILRNNLDSNIKIVNRVGMDVKASCGMFVE